MGVAAGVSLGHRGRAAGSRAAGRAAGGAAVGWPPLGAVLVGGALAVGLLVVASTALGVLQRLGWVTFTPPAVHAAGTYLAAAAGGWTAGRLAGRRGAVVGLGAGLFLCGLAAWALWAGWSGSAGPEAGWGPDWGTSLWRAALVVAVAALAGAVGVAPL